MKRNVQIYKLLDIHPESISVNKLLENYHSYEGYNKLKLKYNHILNYRDKNSSK